MANKNGEGADRQALAKVLRSGPSSHRLSVSIIECGGGAMNGATPGTPDLHYAGKVIAPFGVINEPPIERYVEGWIELKVLNGDSIADRARANYIPVVTGLGHYNSSQRTWAIRHSHVGGRVHLFLRVTWGDEKRYYLFDGRWAAENLGRDKNEDGKPGAFLQDFERNSLFDRRYNPRVMPDRDHMLRALLRTTPPSL